MKRLIFPMLVILGAFAFSAKAQSDSLSPEDDKTKLVDHLNQTGVLFLEGEKLRITKEYFNKAIKLDPEFAQPYVNKGIVLAKKGRIAEALKYFNKALRLDSTSAEALNNRAIIFSQSGQNSKAIEDFTRALELDPYSSIETLYNRGIAQINMANMTRQ